MKRAIITASVASIALVGAFAGQSSATSDSQKRICLSMSYDPQNQGTEPLCVWVPLGE